MNPKELSTNTQEQESFLAWVNQESQRIRDEEGGGLIPQQKRMLAFWEEYRPKMWARLQQAGPDVAKDFALILDTKMWDSDWAYIQAGMAPGDAKMLAQQEWLLMEEEADEEEEQMDEDERREQRILAMLEEMED